MLALASNESPTAIVIGAGPAGLMAADRLARAGHRVAVYDAMRSVGRKFLLAGIGGLNLTHSESLPMLLGRYAERADWLAPLIGDFGPQAIRDWAAGLGIQTFVGSSGRVFPLEMKAAPLLRAWLHDLRLRGVSFHMRHKWRGWDLNGRLVFELAESGVAAPAPIRSVTAATAVVTRPQPPVLILALGGASWPKLGSDGHWVELLRARGVPVRDLRPANCGFDVGWSPSFSGRFAGHPLKPVTLRHDCDDSGRLQRQGELVITETGIEGGLIYSVAAALRDALARKGSAEIELDLMPGWTQARLTQALARPRGNRSLANHWRAAIGLAGVKANLLREQVMRNTGDDPAAIFEDAGRTATLLKALPIRLTATRPIAEAISSAGGVAAEALDGGLMLRDLPGVYCAGEMLDWEAPTGGYLLTACLATGFRAGQAAARQLTGLAG